MCVRDEVALVWPVLLGKREACAAICAKHHVVRSLQESPDVPMRPQIKQPHIFWMHAMGSPPCLMVS